MGTADERHAYVDFKREPHRIRTVLEDFTPYSDVAGIDDVMTMLKWLNGPESALESNDCAFRPPHKNTTDKQFRYTRRCDGRLMILFRDLLENVQPRSVAWLCEALHASIESTDTTFREGAIRISRMTTHYSGLTDLPNKAVAGQQVMLSIFAYGNTKESRSERWAPSSAAWTPRFARAVLG